MNNLVFKKNIILIPADYNGVSNQKGVLSLEQKNDKLEGNLRCYNLKPTNETYMVGVSVGDSTFKTKATAKELSSLKLQINSTLNNTTKISCVIVKLNEKSYDTLLWGSTETTRAMQEHILIQSLLEKTEILNSQALAKEQQKFEDVPSISSEQEEIFQDELLQNYIDKVVKDTEPTPVETQSSGMVKEKLSTTIQDTKRDFYSRVEGQINNFFENNEPDLVLESIIPDSKFCKVNLDTGYYVFGIIYEGGKEKCICYGIPCDYYDVPPREIEGYSQWLPVDANDYQGKGYWLTYQDAKTGENISVEVI